MSKKSLSSSVGLTWANIQAQESKNPHWILILFIDLKPAISPLSTHSFSVPRLQQTSSITFRWGVPDVPA
jgi:hypothetical protein